MADIRIEKAIEWAIGIANDSSHGYSQTDRWGPDYDCSSLVIQAFEKAGVPVKTNGATYTGNMLSVFKKTGFEVVKDGSLKRGDVLLATKSHTAIYLGDSQLVHASIDERGKISGGKKGDQTGKEICVRPYYNKPWDYVLRLKNQETSKAVTGEPKTFIGLVNTKKDPLRVRAEANTNCKTLKTLAKGTNVVLLEDKIDGFYKLANEAGYVSASYIKKNSSVKTFIGIVNTKKDPLRVRAEANTNCKTLKTLAKGTKVVLHEDKIDGFYKLANEAGYVSASYISR